MSRFQIDLAVPGHGRYAQCHARLLLTAASVHACAGVATLRKLLADGAHILDIGGESTRPGAIPPAAGRRAGRVVPVVREAVKLGVPVSSIPTNPRSCAVLDLGADIINDIWALRQPDACSVAAHAHCGVCLMHMHREPTTMQAQPMDGDVLPQVLAFLTQAAQALQGLGVARERIVLDLVSGSARPSRRISHSARPTRRIAGGRLLLAGWSRKSSLATATSTSLAKLATLDIHARMVPSVAAALLAVERGARVVRVHDVRETVQALAVLRAIQ